MDIIFDYPRLVSKKPKNCILAAKRHNLGSVAVLNRNNVLTYLGKHILKLDITKIIRLMKSNYLYLIDRINKLKIVTEKICLERINNK